MKKGDVLVFDSNLIHRSLSLKNNVMVRIVSAGMLAPKDAQVVHHVLHVDNKVEVFEIDEPCFLTYINVSRRDISKYKCTTTVCPDFSKFNQRDLTLFNNIAELEWQNPDSFGSHK